MKEKTLVVSILGIEVKITEDKNGLSINNS